MAEIGVAASLLQIAGAGIKLSLTLYEFGATVSVAGEEVAFVAKNVTLYSGVLQALAQRLKSEDAVHSSEALNLASDIEGQSHVIFKKIEKLLPSPHPRHNSISLLQRIAWNFKKPRVEHLVGQLEYLKSTTALLVQVLFTGELSKTHRQAKKNDQDVDAVCDEIRMGCMRAQSLIIERQYDREKLSTLSEEANGSPMYPLSVEGEEVEFPPPNDITLPKEQALGGSPGELDVLGDYCKPANGGYTRALVLRNSPKWLLQLFSEWTTISKGEILSLLGQTGRGHSLPPPDHPSGEEKPLEEQESDKSDVAAKDKDAGWSTMKPPPESPDLSTEADRRSSPANLHPEKPDSVSGQPIPLEDVDVQEEADYYNQRAVERSFIGEALNGATKDWAIIDVPPGTSSVQSTTHGRVTQHTPPASLAHNGVTNDWYVLNVPPGTSMVHIDGVGGSSQDITWQLHNGVRRSKFRPDGVPASVQTQNENITHVTLEECTSGPPEVMAETAQTSKVPSTHSDFSARHEKNRFNQAQDGHWLCRYGHCRKSPTEFSRLEKLRKHLKSDHRHPVFLCSSSTCAKNGVSFTNKGIMEAHNKSEHQHGTGIG